MFGISLIAVLNAPLDYCILEQCQISIMTHVTVLVLLSPSLEGGRCVSTILKCHQLMIFALNIYVLAPSPLILIRTIRWPIVSSSFVHLQRHKFPDYPGNPQWEYVANSIWPWWDA
jgi:hypothetical protein